MGGPRARHPRHGGTARPPSKISRLRQARPRPAHDCLTIGTGTPIHMTGVPGVPFLWACRAGRTVTARPGQSLVTFMCDNSAIVEALNKTTIRGDAIEPLQLIFLAAALFDIEVRSCWLSSEDNWIADALSRFNLKKLANLQLDQLFFKSTQLQPAPQAGSLNPIQQLRQKLHNFYGTDSPQLHEPPTWPHGQTTNDIRPFTDMLKSP